MAVQLREYRVTPGHMDDFLQVFHEGVVPARRAVGFQILGAFADREANRFVWLVRHDGDDFDAAERAYYDSPGRAAIDPPPTTYLDEVATSMVEAVL